MRAFLDPIRGSSGVRVEQGALLRRSIELLKLRECVDGESQENSLHSTKVALIWIEAFFFFFFPFFLPV